MSFEVRVCASRTNPDLFLSDATLGIPSLLDTLHTDSKSARDFLPAVFTNRQKQRAKNIEIRRWEHSPLRRNFSLRAAYQPYPRLRPNLDILSGVSPIRD